MWYTADFSLTTAIPFSTIGRRTARLGAGEQKTKVSVQWGIVWSYCHFCACIGAVELRSCHQLRYSQQAGKFLIARRTRRTQITWLTYHILIQLIGEKSVSSSADAPTRMLTSAAIDYPKSQPVSASSLQFLGPFLSGGLGQNCWTVMLLFPGVVHARVGIHSSSQIHRLTSVGPKISAQFSPEHSWRMQESSASLSAQYAYVC